MDPATVAAYFELLEQLPLEKKLDEARIERARRYAYHFFFRRMIPLDFITKTNRKHYEVKLDSLAQLNSGNFEGLDVICDGILKGHEFIYPAENLV